MASVWLWSCRVSRCLATLLSLELEGSREGILYDEIYIIRLDAFEMWVYRRVLTISWTEKISNEEVIIIIIIIMAGMAFF